ncbi:hypothetical protein ACSBM8_15395 [Sphingomonas sp. ASY06-1R]|uniref:hypothetical protein n=1 Tax=Sphingomonas sp. ASY06-1R TaxID=3445771 RepID=UPI003FA207AC
MPYLMPLAVRDAFQARGWVSQQGNLYFNGNGGTTHPHLHLILEARGTVQSPPDPSDIRSAVKMLAWSDGQQHNNGGGRTLIRVGGRNFVQGTVNFNQQNQDFLFAETETHPEHLAAILANPQSNANINREMNWICSYFFEG